MKAHHTYHLGTGTLITDATGEAYQFFMNLPFGETMIEQGGYDYDNPYKFNDYGSKKIKYLFTKRIQRSCELDAETGLYYYGARYYDPKISMWSSVDPLAEKYPSFNPYNYVLNNPVKLVDPTGKSVGDPPRNKGLYTFTLSYKINLDDTQTLMLNEYLTTTKYHESGVNDENGNSILIKTETRIVKQSIYHVRAITASDGSNELDVIESSVKTNTEVEKTLMWAGKKNTPLSLDKDSSIENNVPINSLGITNEEKGFIPIGSIELKRAANMLNFGLNGNKNYRFYYHYFSDLQLNSINTGEYVFLGLSNHYISKVTPYTFIGNFVGQYIGSDIRARQARSHFRGRGEIIDKRTYTFN